MLVRGARGPEGRRRHELILRSKYPKGYRCEHEECGACKRRSAFSHNIRPAAAVPALSTRPATITQANIGTVDNTSTVGT